MTPKLAIITPYRERLESLRAFVDSVRDVSKDEVEFLLVVLGDANLEVETLCRSAGVRHHFVNHSGPFQIGQALNIGATVSTADYILKQDIDLIGYDGFYLDLLEFMNRNLKGERDFLNLGYYYMTDAYTKQFLSGRVSKALLQNIQPRDLDQFGIPCGSAFLVNRKHYLSFGGTHSGFKGYGWEDYYVLYMLQTLKQPEFRLKEYSLRSITDRCRDEIARPLNRITNGASLIFFHRWHRRIDDNGYMQYVEANRRLLFRLVCEIRDTHGKVGSA
jgi:predicted glycosyltransferase involved in capsule biosynthesis